ncbi:DUF5787 family protein [Natronosalvus vescus]|uniref:DUF5787 family protein n=1 Tax=Natronosalvus vescus TaxID=2953881 RepID=UPI0020918028|nr:DUF5787 family protein [Natronosalvus vescus]
MSEFAFELELCGALERRHEGLGLLARQLGGSVANPGGRILDIVCVEPGPEFDERTAITPEAIPDLALAADVGTGRARYWKDCFDCHPDTARRVVDRALEIGFFEAERRRGREYIRQVARYPDWYGSLIGIENKPDLGRPGDLEAQLRLDVSLGLVDAAILATESYVTRAHLNRIPEEVGVWRVHRGTRGGVEGRVSGGGRDENSDEGSGDGGGRTDLSKFNTIDFEVNTIESGFLPGEPGIASVTIEVIREPTPLPVDQSGIEPLEYQPGRTDIAVVSPSEKARIRRRIAERAYGKGWRTYGFPACARCTPLEQDGATLPYCEWAERVVDANADCGSACPGYESADEPDVNLTAERDRWTSWVADPAGKRRRQSGLDRFS